MPASSSVAVTKGIIIKIKDVKFRTIQNVENCSYMVKYLRELPVVPLLGRLRQDG